jgi:tetratricopeptide (TPR) repeat protein
VTQAELPDSAAAGFREAANRYREGDLETALRLCDRLLSAAPTGEALPAIFNLKAVILAQRGCLFTAAECIGQAIESSPKEAKLHDHAARIQASLRWLEAAEYHARAACRLAPHAIAYRYQLARILRFKGDVSGAAGAAEACLAAQPSFTEAWVLLSELAGESDDRRQAVECLRQVVDHNPGDVRAWAMLAEFETELTPDLPVEVTLRRLVQTDGKADTRATALFALAGRALRRGDHRSAFKRFRAANELRAGQSPFDIDTWEKMVEGILVGPTPQPPASDDSGRRLVFLVGMPRSGTTLCEQVLSAHPDVFGAGELSAMKCIQNELQHGSGKRGQSATGEQFTGCALTPDGARRAYLQCLPPGSKSHARVVDKAPRNFERLGLILALFPAARVVWMLRHPLDTVLSCYQQDFVPGQDFSNRLDHAARVYAGHARLLRHALKRFGSAISVVEYPDLVKHLETTARSLAEFIGVGFHPAMLRPDLNPRRTRTASSEQVRQRVHTLALDRWRSFAAELAAPREYFERQGLLAADGTSRVCAWLESGSE